ncbi:ATP-binding protein [Xanthomonas campestris pv. raphani]|uniref:ATP-binding protein n=1 Tax=Xanthomonas campestris TaxID=339 RepID=UPI002B23B0C4|nr:ATP-binding protein [Xanthomonas campestris]MEA9654253.1 ATP-binding protein [Xanthomonas campestris pv. raphani]MEA9897072.1 ATP-binding protein [Xanthomonas campestris pv. raphani]
MQDPINEATDASQIRRAGVDLNGLMSVLSKHLYSTPVVALRELVQNAHDSILRRRLEQPEWDGASLIEVHGDPAQGIVRIIDTGAGLTQQEIHDYLATVGVGYTRGLRQSGHEDSGLIGMFGLGFLSAFVLARRVTVRTTSYQTPTLGHCYVSSNAEQYTVSPIAARAQVGTEVVLELHPDYLPLAQEGRLREILSQYCALLREPIQIGRDAQPINPEPPPWRMVDAVPLHPVQAWRRQREFAARFERNFEPLCCMPVRSDEGSDAVGLLWVQDGATYGTSDNRNLSVFLRGMLLDDNARELLPPWAGFIGGVIESNRLTPTASREDLQRDAVYSAVQHALSEALVQGLAEVARQQPEAWRRILLRHNEALLGAALCDERLFELLMEHVRVPTSQGDLPAQQLPARGAVHVILDSDAGFEEMLFRAMGVPVAYGNRYAVVPFLRRWAQAKGMRLVELGTEQGNRQLFHLDSLPADELAWLEQHLGDGEALVPARFSPEELPLVVVPDREAELKRRLEQDENDKRVSTAALRLARQFTARIESQQTQRLYLNLDNPALQSLLAAHRAGNPQAAVAARLLRSLKVIVAAQGRTQQTPGAAEAEAGVSALNRAFGDFAAAVTHLLAR